MFYQNLKEDVEKLTKDNERLKRDITDISGSLGSKPDGDVSV